MAVNETFSATPNMQSLVTDASFAAVGMQEASRYLAFNSLSEAEQAAVLKQTAQAAYDGDVIGANADLQLMANYFDTLGNNWAELPPSVREDIIKTFVDAASQGAGAMFFAGAKANLIEMLHNSEGIFGNESKKRDSAMEIAIQRISFEAEVSYWTSKGYERDAVEYVLNNREAIGIDQWGQHKGSEIGDEIAIKAVERHPDTLKLINSTNEAEEARLADMNAQAESYYDSLEALHADQPELLSAIRALRKEGGTDRQTTKDELILLREALRDDELSVDKFNALRRTAMGPMDNMISEMRKAYFTDNVPDDVRVLYAGKMNELMDGKYMSLKDSEAALARGDITEEEFDRMYFERKESFVELSERYMLGGPDHEVLVWADIKYDNLKENGFSHEDALAQLSEEEQLAWHLRTVNIDTNTVAQMTSFAQALNQVRMQDNGKQIITDLKETLSDPSLTPEQITQAFQDAGLGLALDTPHSQMVAVLAARVVKESTFEEIEAKLQMIISDPSAAREFLSDEIEERLKIKWSEENMPEISAALTYIQVQTATTGVAPTQEEIRQAIGQYQMSPEEFNQQMTDALATLKAATDDVVKQTAEVVVEVTETAEKVIGGISGIFTGALGIGGGEDAEEIGAPPQAPGASSEQGTRQP